ncbi:MAG TPA: hypothetical protein VGG54_26430 [Trebonia sp.]|jgi:hypothetical protein
MRFIRSAAFILTLAGAATLAVSAGPAFAANPVIDVTPPTATPGASVTFAITCGTGSTSATLFGTTLGLPEQIPMDSATEIGEWVVTVDLPTDISPGDYSPSIDCDNGVSGTADLTVNPAPSPATPTPTGAPLTGDGTTSSATRSPFTPAGVALLAAGGLAACAVAIRRRRRARSRS